MKRIAAAILLIAPLAWGQDTSSKADPAAEPVRAFLSKSCLDCHGPEKPKGKFRVDQLDYSLAAKGSADRWAAVHEQLTTGAMPPKGKPRAAKADVDALIAWLSTKSAAVENARRSTQGRVVLRRLNRVEYENTIHDLLAVDVNLGDLLPADSSDHGFDNVGTALHSSSFLMEKYLEAADRSLNAAIASGPKPWIFSKKLFVKDEHPSGDVYRKLDDGSLAIFSSWISANICVTMWQFTSKFAGKYHFKISAYGYQNPGKSATFYVLAGGMAGVTDQHLVGYFDVPSDTPTVVEFTDTLEPNETIRIVAEGLGVTPPTVNKVGAQNYKGPGLAVQWVEASGPLVEAWPPASHKRLFGDLPQEPVGKGRERFEVVSKDPAADADRLLREFARRAFRRAVTDDDLKPFMGRVKTKLAEGYSFEQALRVGFKSILVSPEFLFLREKPGKLDDFALASRLSYFLWSSMPDEELLTLAAGRKLRENLRAQTERMLKDPKAAAFTKNFAGQWLSLRNIDATLPDPALYPEFNDGLKESMIQEPILFFDEVLKNDLPLTNFIHSDWGMINAPLAKLYGIPDIEGRNFRKMTLPPDCHRGGVLTMGAVLKVTANGTTTSPVLRGSWVLDRILGTPPPKPNVDVEAVEPDIRGATTIREQLAKHRSRPECASCHAKIDPPGFALESFDVIGGWRENYRSVGKGQPISGKHYKAGPAVDPSDVLPDGRRFQNIDEFKQLLLADKDQLARALADKLLTYATGGPPSPSDRAAIDAIVRAVKPKDYGFRSLVHEITQSSLFQSK
jgi:mono/diheme cytochrome c family protein